MSYYFVKMGITTRTGGGSALRRSAYQRCTRDPDFDFSHKADELVDHEVMLPEGADPAFEDPVKLWSAVEARENRVNSQFCRTFEISIPNEVPHHLRTDFARELMQPFIEHGVPVEWAIHTETAIFQDVENPHVSAMVGIRQLDENGWTKNKDRSMNNVMRDDAHKKFWAPAMNEFFKKHGIEAHVSHENSHMPVASAKVRRMAKAWKRKGADPEKMPPALAQFMDHREAYLKRRDEELDLMAEIETLEKELTATSQDNITKENHDGRDDARADRGTGSPSPSTDDQRPGADEPRRIPELTSGTASPVMGDDPTDEKRHIANFRTDPANGRGTERRPDVGADDRNLGSDASDRRDAKRRQHQSETDRRQAQGADRSPDGYSRRRLKRRITVNQTASLMKQVRDALPQKPKETRLLDRLRRNHVVRSTADHMKRILAALRPKPATPLHKIRRAQAVQATDENMKTLRRAANAREEEIQLIDDEDPLLEKAHGRRHERELGREGDTETRPDREPIGDRGAGKGAGGTDARGNDADHGRHADQDSARKRSHASRARGHKSDLASVRGRIRNNKFKKAAEGAATLAREANEMANDSPTITPPLDPNDPTWAQKALNAWSNGHRM